MPPVRCEGLAVTPDTQLPVCPNGSLSNQTNENRWASVYARNKEVHAYLGERLQARQDKGCKSKLVKGVTVPNDSKLIDAPPIDLGIKLMPPRISRPPSIGSEQSSASEANYSS
jgi:hypothetical protein